MTERLQRRLPRVIVSSVIRSTHQGESHGGVYLVDLETEVTQQCLDWTDVSISWYGRGAERGLRGMAFHGGCLYLAASDALHVYGQDLRLRGSFHNRYLKHCHEISITGDSLFLTSTGFDSVLEFDLVSRTFVRGYSLRHPNVPKLGSAVDIARIRRRLRVRPSFSIFDPNEDGGPRPGDTTHINNAYYQDGTLYVAGTGLGNLWKIEAGRLRRSTRLPFRSHNARPFMDGVLLNDTEHDRIALLSRRGRVLKSLAIPRYPKDELLNAGLADDIARQAFGRGLAVADGGMIVGGSSPATVSLYQLDPPRLVKAVNLTMDVRNSVHGLEIWPFG